MILYLLFAISVLSTVSAHLCFKKGVLKLGELSVSLPGVIHIIQNGWILLGGALFVISFLTWLFILSKMQLNIAYPIIIGIEAVLVALISWFLFHEYLSWLQILGIACVIIGIILISPRA